MEISMKIRYAILSSSKAGINKYLKEENQYYDYSSFPSMGLIIPEGYVIIDFDGDNVSNDNIIYDEKIVSWILKKYPTHWTKSRPNHFHLYYKIPQGIYVKKSSDVMTIGGFQIDYLTPNTLAAVKIDNVVRESSGELTEEVLKNLPNLPVLCYPMYKEVKFKAVGLIDHDGRDSLLFNHIVEVRHEYKNLDISEAIHFINHFLFREPLKDKIIESMLERISGGINNLGNKTYELLCLNNIQEKEAKWLWYPYIPLGTLCLLVGDPGIGKSYISLYIASRLSRGEKFPYSNDSLNMIRDPANVLIQNGEDAVDYTIRQRINLLGGDANYIYMIDESNSPFHIDNISELEKFIKEKQFKLVVIDPLQQYLPVGSDMNKANEVRSSLVPLKELADKYECTIILIMHRNKNNGTSSIYRALGSIDFVGSCRSMVSVIKIDDRTYIRHDKCSIGPKGKDLEFEITDEGITFKESEIEKNIKLDTYNKAYKIIKDKLIDGKKIRAREMIDYVKDNGISDRTLRKINQELGIKHCQIDKKHYWYIDKDS